MMHINVSNETKKLHAEVMTCLVNLGMQLDINYHACGSNIEIEDCEFEYSTDEFEMVRTLAHWAKSYQDGLCQLHYTVDSDGEVTLTVQVHTEEGILTYFIDFGEELLSVFIAQEEEECDTCGDAHDIADSILGTDEDDDCCGECDNCEYCEDEDLYQETLRPADRHKSIAHLQNRYSVLALDYDDALRYNRKLYKKLRKIKKQLRKVTKKLKKV